VKTVVWSATQPLPVEWLEYHRTGELRLDDDTGEIVYKWELRAHQHTIFENLEQRKRLEAEIEEIDREIDRLDHTGRDLTPLYEERERLVKLL